MLQKLATLGEGRKLKELAEIARLIGTFEPELEELGDEELRAKTGEFRERLDRGSRLDDLLIEAFALRPRGGPAARSASATTTCS
ncbi:MAG: hypothetical protein KatS3mg013_0886 [Actinomycetota bacterium]|nr:MAG: hypothetical protein KatS3mg013_0886 [Actinomycetota bacterium]